MKATLPEENEIRAALHAVIDPELGIDIVELGLVYAIDIEGDRIRVAMTATSPACPTAVLMAEEARAAIAARVPAGVAVDVDMVWDPPWEPDRMSENAKKTLGW